jgi:hemolysin activation/secretion protein
VRQLARFVLPVAAWLALGASAFAQAVPAPSQVAPPVIVPPTGGGHIAIPQVPAGAQIPPQANKLSFKLLGFDIKGEFEELAAQRKELEAPLIGKRITVAAVFQFADKLQQIYVHAGYPLVRVVILPQEFEGAARIKLRIIDGFVERMDLEAIDPLVRGRVSAVLAPLMGKTHLKQSELERRLLIAGEAPGLILNAVFAAGKKVGGSVLVLTGRYRPVSFSVYSDNAMPASFGTGQVVTTASLNSVLGFGEQLTVSAAGLPDKDFTTRYPTRRYLSGSFVIPLGIDGWAFDIGGTNGITTPRVNLDAVSQGLLSQGHIKLSYEAVKLRDFELTFNGRFEATNEEIDTLLFMPQIPLSEDRLRVLRGGIDGIWRLRVTGTTVSFGSNFSQGLDAFGARTAADANPLLPLSRQGADAVFKKWDGHAEVYQSLPYDFFASVAASGQTSFKTALLTSEQFSIDGAKMLSGFTSGALPGDTAWVVRGELGHPFTFPIESGGLTLTPYAFGATGERILEVPTVLEIGSVHATNYGAGMRFNLTPWGTYMPDGYGFIEWSRRYATDPTLDGDRIYTGMLLRY